MTFYLHCSKLELVFQIFLMSFQLLLCLCAFLRDIEHKMMKFVVFLLEYLNVRISADNEILVW